MIRFPLPAIPGQAIAAGSWNRRGACSGSQWGLDITGNRVGLHVHLNYAPMEPRRICALLLPSS